MGFFSCLLCLTFAFALVSASGKEIVLTKKNFAQVVNESSVFLFCLF